MPKYEKWITSYRFCNVIFHHNFIVFESKRSPETEDRTSFSLEANVVHKNVPIKHPCGKLAKGIFSSCNLNWYNWFYSCMRFKKKQMKWQLLYPGKFILVKNCYTVKLRAWQQIIDEASKNTKLLLKVLYKLKCFKTQLSYEESITLKHANLEFYVVECYLRWW